METQISQKPLLYEVAANWMGQKIKENKLPLASSLIIGLLSYMFAFTNKFVNHDEIYNLFGKGATVDSGRWGLGLLDSIFPNYSMPWIYGIITILLMAISVAFIVNIFDIRSKVLQILLAGCIIAFPSLTGTFTFMYTSSSYAVGFLFSVIAVFLLQKKSWIGWIFAIGFAVFSVAIYQAYIAVTSSLLVLNLIQRLLKEEKLEWIIRRGILSVMFLIVSLGLYYVAMKLSLMVYGLELNDYAQNRVQFGLASITSGVSLAYQNFWNSFAVFRYRLIPTYFSRKIHYLGLIITGLLLIFWGIALKKKSFSRFLLLMALIGLLPLAINCMYIFSGERGVHTLVLYSFTAIYILMILVADTCRQIYQNSGIMNGLRRFLINVIAICLALIVCINVYIANISFLAMHIQYEALYSFYSTLIAEMRLMPEFDENTKLAVIGRWKFPEYYEKYFSHTYELYGAFEALPGLYSEDRFMEYYIGVKIPVATEKEIKAICESEQFKNMALYPYYGSMEMFGDILVVKLSQ